MKPAAQPPNIHALAAAAASQALKAEPMPPAEEVLALMRAQHPELAAVDDNEMLWNLLQRLHAIFRQRHRGDLIRERADDLRRSCRSAMRARLMAQFLHPSTTRPPFAATAEDHHHEAGHPEGGQGGSGRPQVH